MYPVIYQNNIFMLSHWIYSSGFFLAISESLVAYIFIQKEGAYNSTVSGNDESFKNVQITD